MSVSYSFLRATSMVRDASNALGQPRPPVADLARRIANISTLGLSALAAVVWALPAATAEELPKWEAGIAAGGGWTPHYPAADEGNAAIAGVPYLKYRGQRLRLGEDGLVTGRLFRTARVHVTASVRGSLPASSNDNTARAGMPDLDALFEVGPQVELLLAGHREDNSVSLKLPVRFVFSTDFSNLRDRGVVFQPRLSYHHEGLFGSDDLSATASIGPSFASERLMDYFYEVPPQFATPERPASRADGGYLGSDLAFSLTYRVSPRFNLLVGTEVSYYGGATNRDSPLFRSDTGVKAGVGFAWKLWTSEATAPD